MNLAECRARLEGTQIHVVSFRNRGGKFYLKVEPVYLLPVDKLIRIVYSRFPCASITSVVGYKHIATFRLHGDEE